MLRSVGAFVFIVVMVDVILLFLVGEYFFVHEFSRIAAAPSSASLPRRGIIKNNDAVKSLRDRLTAKSGNDLFY
jgi:hypothetical protein